MNRIYALGIIFCILALNIPEVHGNIRNRITFYSPIVASRLSSARDIVEPAIVSIIGDLQQKATVTINGKPINNVDVSDNWQLDHRNSLSAEQFDAILRDYNSPAAGVGKPVTDYAQEKNIDNAYVLYIFIHESTAGTSSNWNAETKNVGNIICAGYSNCIGRFRKYNTWEDGFRASIDNLVAYREDGTTNIDTAIQKWSPPNENDTDGYITSLKENVRKWRSVNQGKFVAVGDKGPLSVFKPFSTSVKQVESIPLVLSGCLGTNVDAAYNSSPGLREITIAPNKDWSFNEHWTIDYNAGVACGVFYGGICDMAGRYSNAAHQLGLETEYTYHGFNLNNLSAEDSTAIWSDGSRGGQDLILKNTTNKTAKLRSYITGGEFIVTAWFE